MRKCLTLDQLVSLFETLDIEMNGYLTAEDMRKFLINIQAITAPQDSEVSVVTQHERLTMAAKKTTAAAAAVQDDNRSMNGYSTRQVGNDEGTNLIHEERKNEDSLHHKDKSNNNNNSAANGSAMQRSILDER